MGGKIEDVTGSGQQQKTKANNDTDTKALMGLFDPPPFTPKRSTETETKTSSSDADDVHADINAPSGSVSHMMGLFAPPLFNANDNASQSSLSPNPTSRMSSLRAAQKSPEMIRSSEMAPLLGDFALSSSSNKNPYHTPQSSVDMNSRDMNNIMMLSIGDGDKTPIADRRSYGSVVSSNISDNGNAGGHVRLMSSNNHARMPSVAMPSISESRAQIILAQPDLNNNNNSHHQHDNTHLGIVLRSAKNVIHSLQIPTTYIGSLIYVLYHVVFCLALGSAIMRPNNPVSILGLMTKTAALGTLAASPIYWVSLSQDVPALYPTADLFLAPFLAKLAVIVDQTLADDSTISEEENDAIFLASFGVLTTIGTVVSACLLLAASVFKLANLGSYLPFPVICGFFAAVGILTWTSAINVDTGGKSIGVILTSGDFDLIRYALVHHIPTIIVAGFMKYLGPKNPFFVCLVVVVTIALFYVFMLVTGTTLEEMKEDGWFWSHEELVYDNYSSTLGFDVWAPPAPFGVPVAIHQVHWGAVRNGLSTAIAMSFLYLIRCSVYVFNGFVSCQI